MSLVKCVECGMEVSAKAAACANCGTPIVPDERDGTDDASNEATLKDQLKDVWAQAKSYTMDDIKGGAWFASFLRYALEAYAKKVDAAYFRAKYPNVPTDAVIDRRIALAKRYAAIEGGVSAGAYTAAIAATIGSGGGSSPITLPAAAAAGALDLLYTTRLQLHLAYDISVLYGYRIDMEDPEDLYDLVRVAFGVKAGEVLRTAVLKASPEAVRVGVKILASGARLAWLKALPVVGKYLLQRSLIKFAIPGVGIPLSVWMNYWYTGAIARVARQVYRNKAASHEKAAEIGDAGGEAPLLVLKAMWLVMRADKTTAPEEAWLLNDVTKQFDNLPGGQEAVHTFAALVDIKDDDVLNEIRAADPRLRHSIWEAACESAAVDHKIQKEEKPVLKRLAEACGQEYDEKKLNEMAKQGVV